MTLPNSLRKKNCAFVCTHHCRTSESKKIKLLSISELASRIPKNHWKSWIHFFFASAWLHLRNCKCVLPLNHIQWQDGLPEIIIKMLFSVKKEFQLLWKAFLIRRRKVGVFSIMCFNSFICIFNKFLYKKTSSILKTCHNFF